MQYHLKEMIEIRSGLKRYLEKFEDKVKHYNKEIKDLKERIKQMDDLINKRIL